jgi:two-component sensor histidine kinase
MDVIEGAIAVHRPSEDRIRVAGPRLDLGTKAALALTLALHELCTNAQKYGALSNDAGTVSINWSISGGATDAQFRLVWKEEGGPSVTPPSIKGFGSRLIAGPIGADFGGQAQLTFDPAGVVWTLQGPLNPLKSNAFEA